jgi:hypothetical protein
MKGLDFLKKASLVANEIVKPATARTVTAKNRNPENADIRIYKDGSVYPSAALVVKHILAYVAKDVEPKGTAFDVFKSSEFLNTKHWPADETVIFIAAVDRSQPKTDLFSSTKYDEAGAPTADVLTQGSNTFGKKLLVDLKEVYDVEPNEEGFIDLVIMGDTPFNTPDSIYYVPKLVSRGEKIGQSDLVRRENLTLFPLVPAAMLAEQATADSTPAGIAAVQETVPTKAKASAVPATEEVEI